MGYYYNLNIIIIKKCNIIESSLAGLEGESMSRPCKWCMRNTCEEKGGYEKACPVERNKDLPEQPPQQGQSGAIKDYIALANRWEKKAQEQQQRIEALRKRELGYDLTELEAQIRERLLCVKELRAI